jgi:hypothetical protein
MTTASDFVVSNLVSVPQGALINFNSQLLAPPFRMPYLIRELRFYGTFPTRNAGVAAVAFQHVKLSMGHKDLTRDFMPIGLLCPAVQKATDEAGNVYPYSVFRWVLPKPMYCRAGEGIDASVHNVFNLLTGNTLTLELSVVGEVLPPGAPVPKTTSIPFASVYSTGGNSPYAASDGVSLRNPWMDKILHMQRFLGNGYIIGAGSTWRDANVADTSSPIVILVDSEDRTGILPSPGVLFGEGFDARTRCLEHRRPLKPKGWFQATLTNISSQRTYYISMIGHREEAIS